MTIYEIDGERFSTLEEFFAELDRVMHLDEWGHNLDAFNDVLRGGFGTPKDGFTIRWRNHQTSQQRLGYSETIRQLKRRLERCHPAERERVLDQTEDAEQQRGETVFDWLVEIVRKHGPGGSEEEARVELILD